MNSNQRESKFRPGRDQRNHVDSCKKVEQIPQQQDKIQKKWYSKVGFYGCNYHLAELFIMKTDTDKKNKLFNLFREIILEGHPNNQGANSNAQLQIERKSYEQELQNPKQDKEYNLIPQTEGIQKAIEFLKNFHCYFHILADIDNAEELFKKIEQLKKKESTQDEVDYKFNQNYQESISGDDLLDRIGLMDIYLPKKSKNYELRVQALKEKYPNKIGGVVFDFDQYVKKLRPFIKTYQAFVLKFQDQIHLDSKRIRNLLPSFQVVDDNITGLNDHKLHVTRPIKLLEHLASCEKRSVECKTEAYQSQKNQLLQSNQNQQELTQKPVVEPSGNSVPLIESEITRLLNKFCEYLKNLNGSEDQFSKGIRNQIIEIKRNPGYLNIENEPGLDKQYKDNLAMQNIIKILCLYKIESFYYHALNCILRVAKRLSDFDVIAIPLSETFHAIKNVYDKQIKANKGKRPGMKLWRAVKFHDFQKIKQNPGKLLEFFGFSSFSKSKQKALGFIPKEHWKGYVLIELTIPEYKYDDEDFKGLEHDYGFVDLKEWVIQGNEKFFGQTMKRLEKAVDKTCESYAKEPEEEVLSNVLNTYMYDKMRVENVELGGNAKNVVDNAKVEKNTIDIEIYEFTYVTPHEIQKKLNSTAQQNCKSQNSISPSTEECKYLEKSLEHYTVFNSKYSKSKNLGDVYFHLGDFDRAKSYTKSLLDKKQKDYDPENILKYNECCMKTGSNEGFKYVKQQALDYIKNHKVEQSEKEKKIEDVIKKCLSSHEDNIVVIDMLQKKLSLLENKEENWLIKAQIMYEIGMAYQADGKWHQAETEMTASCEILNEKLSHIKVVCLQVKNKLQEMESMCGCFVFSSPDVKEIEKEIKSIKTRNQQLLKGHDLLIEVTYQLIECEKKLSMIRFKDKQTQQKQNSQHCSSNDNTLELEELESIVSKSQTILIKKKQFLELIELKKYLLEEKQQIPLKMKLYQLQVSNSISQPEKSSSNRQDMIQLINQQITKITNKNSIEYIELQSLKNNLASTDMIESIKSPNSIRYQTDESKIKIDKSIKKIRSTLNIKSQKLFDIEAYQKQRESIIKDMQDNLNLLAKLNGESLEVLKQRLIFVDFLLNTNQVQKSIQQAFINLKSCYADKHSAGAETFLSLSKSFHMRGEQKESFKSLAMAIEILRRAKVKQETNQYQILFQVSQTRLKIQLMRSKVYLTQVKQDFKIKALDSLDTVQNTLKDKKCSVGLTLMVKVSEEKGNLLATVTEKKFQAQLQSVSPLHQNQTSLIMNSTTDNAAINMISKTQSTGISQQRFLSQILKGGELSFLNEFNKAIERQTKQSGEKSLDVMVLYCNMAQCMLERDLKKAEEFYEKAYEIAGGLPPNHPYLWSCFLVKSMICEKKTKNKKVNEGQIKEDKEKILLKKASYKLVRKRYCQESYCRLQVSFNYLKQVRPKDEVQKNKKKLLLFQLLRLIRTKKEECPVDLDGEIERGDQSVASTMREEVKSIEDQKETLLWYIRMYLFEEFRIITSQQGVPQQVNSKKQPVIELQAEGSQSINAMSMDKESDLLVLQRSEPVQERKRVEENTEIQRIKLNFSTKLPAMRPQGDE